MNILKVSLNDVATVNDVMLRRLRRKERKKEKDFYARNKIGIKSPGRLDTREIWYTNTAII